MAGAPEIDIDLVFVPHLRDESFGRIYRRQVQHDRASNTAAEMEKNRIMTGHRLG